MGNYIKQSPVFSGGTISGDTNFVGNLSGGTLFSGSTNLYDIFSTGGGSNINIQPGLNTYTGGTDLNPNVNISGLTIDNIFVSGETLFNTLSASTIYSGDTDLSYYIDVLTQTGISLQNEIDTNSQDIISLSSSTSSYTQVHTFNSYTADTNSTLNTHQTEINSKASSTSVAVLQTTVNTIETQVFGLEANISTLNSQIPTKASLSGDTFYGQVNFSSLSGNSISGGTFYSGSTPLTTIINNIASQYSGITGNYLPLSGGTVSGTTNFNNSSIIQSGGTDLYSIFASQTDLLNYTEVDVFNSYTADTNTTLNSIQSEINFISGATSGYTPLTEFTGYTASTNTTLNSIQNEINLISGATSGYTSLIQFTGYTASTNTTLVGLQSQLNTAAFLTGATFSGSIYSPTISGGTFYSGSTPLTTIINNIASKYSGATGNFLSLSGGTVSGTTNFNNGAVIKSGGTDLYNIFSTGGGSGSPGGTNTDIQFNNSGSFAGSSALTFNSTTCQLVAASQQSIVSNSNRSSIIGGCGNKLYYSMNSSIIGGCGNRLDNCSYQSVIIGGFNNVMNYCSKNASIIGGGANCIKYGSYDSSIIGSLAGYMNNSSASLLLGGSSPRMSYAANSLILGGINNQICSDSDNSTIIGGYCNCICDSSWYSSIVGGCCNAILGSYSTSIISGLCNKIYSSTRTSIIGGCGLTVDSISDIVMVPNIIIANIPKTDPHVVGQLWSNLGIVKVSVG